MSSSYYYSAISQRQELNVKLLPRPVSNAARTGSFVSAVMLFCVLCLQLGVRIAIVEQGYELESARNVLMENDKQLRQYRLQYAVHTSPERLSRLAQQKLGLYSSRPQQLRKIVF